MLAAFTVTIRLINNELFIMWEKYQYSTLVLHNMPYLRFNDSTFYSHEYFIRNSKTALSTSDYKIEINIIFGVEILYFD